MKKSFTIIGLIFSILYVSAQSLSSVYPSTGQQSQSLIVTISGQNTHFMQGTLTISNPTQIWLKHGDSVSVVPNYRVIMNDNQILAEFTFQSNSPTGLYDVNVYSNLDGFLSLPGALYLNPASYSIEPQKITSSQSVFPNPGNGCFTVTQSNSGAYRIELYSQKGDLLFSEENTAGTKSQWYDVTHLAKGSYIYQIISGEGIEKGVIVFQ